VLTAAIVGTLLSVGSAVVLGATAEGEKLDVGLLLSSPVVGALLDVGETLPTARDGAMLAVGSALPLTTLGTLLALGLPLSFPVLGALLVVGLVVSVVPFATLGELLAVGRPLPLTELGDKLVVGTALSPCAPADGTLLAEGAALRLGSADVPCDIVGTKLGKTDAVAGAAVVCAKQIVESANPVHVVSQGVVAPGSKQLDPAFSLTNCIIGSVHTCNAKPALTKFPASVKSESSLT
jgi:hypothetical protein